MMRITDVPISYWAFIILILKYYMRCVSRVLGEVGGSKFDVLHIWMSEQKATVRVVLEGIQLKTRKIALRFHVEGWLKKCEQFGARAIILVYTIIKVSRSNEAGSVELFWAEF